MMKNDAFKKLLSARYLFDVAFRHHVSFHVKYNTKAYANTMNMLALNKYTGKKIILTRIVIFRIRP